MNISTTLTYFVIRPFVGKRPDYTSDIFSRSPSLIIVKTKVRHFHVLCFQSTHAAVRCCWL